MSGFTVAQLFSFLVDRSDKTQEEIAKEVGISSINTISMIKSGKSRLPIARISSFAKALDFSEEVLLDTALREYEPELHRMILAHGGGIAITPPEYAMILRHRARALSHAGRHVRGRKPKD